MYVDLVKEHHREFNDFIHGHGAMVKVHICGNIIHLLPHLAELNPAIVDIDWTVDMERSFDMLGPEIIRSGNLDPVTVIEQLPAEEIYARTKALVAKERGRPFILSGGCEITPYTPPENLMALRNASVER